MVWTAAIRVRDKGLRAMAGAFRQAISLALADWGDAVLEEADRNVPVGASIGLNLKQSGDRIPGRPRDWVMVRYDAPYALYVHEGTRAHWPPKGVLVRWIELVLGVHGKEAQQLDYLIRRKIARFGTAPQPWLREAVETVDPHVEGIFARRFEQAAKRLGR